MSAPATLEVFEDKQTVAQTVADRFVELLGELLAVPGDVHVALTGGSIGIASLAAVADSAGRESLPWSRVHFWWGDERFVPKDDPERNERQARDALLDALEVPGGNVHPFPASDEAPDLQLARELYVQELARYGEAQPWPTFAVTFLGVGPDGHVASLFPGFAQVRVDDTSVVSVQGSPKPPPLRLSLTRPVINSSERVWLVLSGEDKAEALKNALDGADPMTAPVAGVSGVEQTIFFADRAAASLLSSE